MIKEILACLIIGLTSQLSAQESEKSSPSFPENYKLSSPTLGIQLGSMGIGIQYTHPLSERWNLRGTASYFDIALPQSIPSSTVNTERVYSARLGGIGAIADYSFSKKTPNWKLAMGLFYQINRVGIYQEFTYVGDDLNEDLGTLDLQFDSFPVSPYAGLVFGNFKSQKRVTFSLELGTLFHGRPNVTFTGTGRIGPTAEQDELVAENVSNYNWFPYANFQLNFKLSK